MRDQLFHLDARNSATLQTQLRQMLVAAIREGQLPRGSALPSCRKLADTLAVARNTVALAYQDLVEEGFLVARQRSGYFVCQEIDPARLDLEQTHLFAAMDFANASSDLDGALRIERLLQRLDGTR